MTQSNKDKIHKLTVLIKHLDKTRSNIEHTLSFLNKELIELKRGNNNEKQ